MSSTYFAKLIATSIQRVSGSSPQKVAAAASRSAERLASLRNAVSRNFSSSASSPTLSIFAFRGARGGNVKQMAATQQIPSTIYTGHVGISLDGGQSIFAFNPHLENEDFDKASDLLFTGGSLPGTVSDDTEIFQNALDGVYDNVGDMPLQVYKLDTRIPARACNQIDDLLRCGLDTKMNRFHYGYPLAGAQSDDSKTSILSPVQRRANCATFFAVDGIKLPETTGNMRNYIPALVHDGARSLNTTCSLGLLQ